MVVRGGQLKILKVEAGCQYVFNRTASESNIILFKANPIVELYITS